MRTLLLAFAVCCQAAYGASPGFSMLNQWTPRSIPSLGMWLDGGALSSLADGTFIASWPDNAFYTSSVQQPTGANQPVKVTTDGNVPAARFVTSRNTYLVITNGTVYSKRAFSAYWLYLNGPQLPHVDSYALCDFGDPGHSAPYWNAFQINGSSDNFSPLIDDGNGNQVGGTNFISNATLSMFGWVSSGTGVSYFNDNWSESIPIAPAQSFSNGHIGHFLNTVLPISGDLFQLVTFTAALTASQDANVKAFLGRYRVPPVYSIVCCGDSLTGGWHGAGGTNYLYPDRYPDQMAIKLGRAAKVLNYGVGGQTISYFTNHCDVSLGGYIGTNGLATNVVVFWIGSNDLTSGATAADMESEYAYLVTKTLAGGAFGLQCTLLPRVDVGGTTETLVRQPFNTWIRTNYASSLVDLASDSRLNSYTNTTYFDPDGIHLTKTGYAAVGELVANAVKALH